MEGVKSMAEIIPEWEKEMERRKEFCKRCRIEDGYVVLTYDEKYPNGSTYDIELERIDTHEKLIQWVMHLIEKTWVTKELIELFIYTVCNHFVWKSH